MAGAVGSRDDGGLHGRFINARQCTGPRGGCAVREPSLDNMLGRLYGPGDGKTFEGVIGKT